MSEVTSTDEIQHQGPPPLPSRYHRMRFAQLALPRATDEQVPDQCPICLEEFHDSNIDHMPVITLCNHVFGRSCLLKWFANGYSCPMCRKQLPEFYEDKWWQRPNQALFELDFTAFFSFTLTAEGVYIIQECNTRTNAMNLLYGRDWNRTVVEDDRDMALEAARWAQTRSQLRVAAGLDAAEEIDREIACLMLLSFDDEDHAAIELRLPNLEVPFDRVQVVREIREATEVRDHLRFLRRQLGLLDQTDEVRRLLTHVARNLSAREDSVNELWASIYRHQLPRR